MVKAKEWQINSIVYVGFNELLGLLLFGGVGEIQNIMFSVNEVFPVYF